MEICETDGTRAFQDTNDVVPTVAVLKFIKWTPNWRRNLRYTKLLWLRSPPPPPPQGGSCGTKQRPGRDQGLAPAYRQQQVVPNQSIRGQQINGPVRASKRGGPGVCTGWRGHTVDAQNTWCTHTHTHTHIKGNRGVTPVWTTDVNESHTHARARARAVSASKGLQNVGFSDPSCWG